MRVSGGSVAVVLSLIVLLVGAGYSTARAPTSAQAVKPPAATGAHSSDGRVGTPTSGVKATPEGWGHAMAVEAALRAHGARPGAVHLPNFPGMVADRDRPVTPSYTEAPAPMGVADIGLENRSGVLTPYSLNTSSVEGTIHVTDLRSLYLDGDGPDTFGIQLNSVVTRVMISGNSSFQFWSQNYVDYTPSTQALIFGDEVWNFSDPSGYFPANSVYGFGPNGTLGLLPVLYQGYGPTIGVGYPFTLSLYLNTTVESNRSVLFFNYTVANASIARTGSFDFLAFNSTVGATAVPVPTPVYQANGYAYDPIGLINDMELDVIGNDNGDMTSFFQANATVALAYLNGSARAMEAVPSAVNAGQETGETSNGLSVFSNGGTSPVAEIRAGPSFLGGLWNYSATSGAVALKVHLRPANAFIFVVPGSSPNASLEQWVPSSPTGATIVYLPTGPTYDLQFLMSEYVPVGTLFHAVAPGTLTIALVRNVAYGIYTPLYAFGNAELANISSAGSGTAASPYQIENNQYGPLDPEFAAWDDYLFPAFPGLLLDGTTAWAEISPPSFAIDIPAWQLDAPFISGLGLPNANDLQIQLYRTSNVSVVGAPGISGWLCGFLDGFPLGSLMLWDSTGDLVAGNQFADEGSAIDLYGGTNNTIWGNTFVPTNPVSASNASLLNAGGFATGVNESESGDLIFNNYFGGPVPATTPGYDPVPCAQYGDCAPVRYTDLWNVTAAPASAYRIVDGRNLSGSILGTADQGGNYWPNYGRPSNPYGALPYNDTGWITTGGDFAPLVPFPLYAVNFSEVGLAPGTNWSVALLGLLRTTNGSGLSFESPAGVYRVDVSAPLGYTTTPSFYIPVFGDEAFNISFQLLAPATFTPNGLGTGAGWGVELVDAAGGSWFANSSGPAPATVQLPVGLLYTYFVSAPEGERASPAAGNFTLAATGVALSVNFTVTTGTLALRVTPPGATVAVDGLAETLAAGGSLDLALVPQVASISATAPGYAPYFDNVSIRAGAVTSLNITMTPIPGVPGATRSPGGGGASNGSSDQLLLEGVIAGLVLLSLVLLADILYLSSRRPPPPPAGGNLAPGYGRPPR